jgi:hypothetical protein
MARHRYDHDDCRIVVCRFARFTDGDLVSTDENINQP